MTTSINASPALSPNLNYGVRDVTCLTVALAVHALLLLWKGGVFNLPTPEKQDNVLVSVSFVSEMPAYEAPAAPAPKQSLLSQMKSLIKGETHTPKPKADVFAQKTAPAKPDALEIAKGQTKEVTLVTAPPTFKPAQANLKQTAFKVNSKDVPFKIATAKDQDVLANVNAVAVQVGPKTTTSKVFDSARTPALQSKTFAGRTPDSSSALSMGASGRAQSSPALNAGSGLATSASAVPAARTGKEFSGGSGFGSSNVATLPRNGAGAFDSPVETGKSVTTKGSGFNITGALAKRPIAQKVFPKYEIDGRVALRFRVDWSGRVLDGILVEISSGSPSFDQKVVAALKEWSFSRLPSDRANEVQEGVVTFIFKGV